MFIFVHRQRFQSATEDLILRAFQTLDTNRNGMHAHLHIPIIAFPFSQHNCFLNKMLNSFSQLFIKDI